MRLCILVSFLFLSSLTHAQQFEWASSGDNLNGGVRTSVLDKEGNMIVAGNFITGGYSYNADRSLYSSSGDSLRVSYLDFMFIASFSPQGKINWLREVKGASDPMGMGLDEKGNIVLLASNRNNPSFPEIDVRVDEGRHFILHLSPKGKAVKVIVDTLNVIRDPIRFAVSKQGGYFVSQTEYSIENTSKGAENVDWMVLLKLDDEFKTSWKEKIRRFGSHGYFMPGLLFDEAANGDIYGVVAIAEGAEFQGKKFNAKVVDSVHEYNPPFESFLFSYDKSGKLKWVKPSGGKSIFSSIKVSDKGIYLGGNVLNNLNFFGKKIDTTEKKKMVLANFNFKGNINWVQTTKAHTIKALATDQDENVYAIVESKVSYPDSMAFFYDTLKNVYESMLIASFDSKGIYRWIKHTKLPMSTNEFPTLLTNDCGDIYVAGELWWVMKAEMKWFDAALVKGHGYGPMPFVGKIKNTLPAFVKKEPEACVISPAPWTIRNFPNPFRSVTTVEYKTTYRDENVSLMLYGINGNLVKMIFGKKLHNKGTHTLQLQADSLPPGVYILVLRGTEAVATERIVVLK